MFLKENDEERIIPDQTHRDDPLSLKNEHSVLPWLLWSKTSRLQVYGPLHDLLKLILGYLKGLIEFFPEFFVLVLPSVTKPSIKKRLQSGEPVP